MNDKAGRVWTVVLLRQHNCMKKAPGGVGMVEVGPTGFLSWKVVSLPFVPFPGLGIGYDGREVFDGTDDEGFETTIEDRVESVVWNADRHWFEAAVTAAGVEGVETTVQQMAEVYPGWYLLRYYDEDTYFAAIEKRHRTIRAAAAGVREAAPKRRRHRQ